MFQEHFSKFASTSAHSNLFCNTLKASVREGDKEEETDDGTVEREAFLPTKRKEVALVPRSVNSTGGRPVQKRLKSCREQRWMNSRRTTAPMCSFCSGPGHKISSCDKLKGFVDLGNVVLQQDKTEFGRNLVQPKPVFVVLNANTIPGLMDDSSWKNNQLPTNSYHVSVLKLIVDSKEITTVPPRSRYSRVAPQPSNFLPFMGALCHFRDIRGDPCCGAVSYTHLTLATSLRGEV